MKNSHFNFLEGAKIGGFFLEKIIVNKNQNDIILKHYKKLQKEFSDVNFIQNIIAIDNCNKYWQLDYYKEQKVKDFKRTNLCKDKFCNNCKKIKQASRLSRFMPIIDEVAKNNYLYHIVLTVPNCNGCNLKETINNLFKSFKYLIDYLSLNKKIKGIDFSQYGFKGAIRSLEVTFNVDSYHPHLHCVFAFKTPLNDYKYISNTFSNSRKNGKRLFTDTEILIQKIWYLLNNRITVNKKNIDSLDVGYSCTIDLVNKNTCYEVFKYMTKTKDEVGRVLSYKNFKDLYFALYRVKQIQGYGIFYRVKDDEKIVELVDNFYDELIKVLKEKEYPLEIIETPEDLITDKENIIISRKKVFSYLKEIL